MISKIRRRLILAAMLSLLAVLTLLVGVSAALNYRSVVDTADQTLALLQENDGEFSADLSAPPQGGGQPQPSGQDEPRPGNPELPYESRYFTVFLTGQGAVVSINTGRIAAVDSAQAQSYALQVWGSGKTRGFIDHYRYVAYPQDGETHIIFLDCGRGLDNLHSFLRNSALVSLAGLAAVFVLLLLLSDKLVKPFADNYVRQKQFITDAGHDLKTPLTIINADADVLQMDIGENEWLSDIKEQTRRMTELTNDLVTLAKMDEDTPRLQSIEFPLSDVAEQTVSDFRAPALTQNKTLSSDIQPMITMTGDEKLIRQLLTVLLDNAVKYSDDHGTIEVKLAADKKQIRLTVYNTADHVSRADLPKMFDRFYRADASRNSRTGGYGLGLSIAKAVAEAHKGKITASTADERSLLITVVFPR